MQARCGSPSRFGSISHNLVLQARGRQPVSCARIGQDVTKEPGLQSMPGSTTPCLALILAGVPRVGCAIAPCTHVGPRPPAYPRLESGQLEPMILAGVWASGNEALLVSQPLPPKQFPPHETAGRHENLHSHPADVVPQSGASSVSQTDQGIIPSTGFGMHSTCARPVSCIRDTLIYLLAGCRARAAR